MNLQEFEESVARASMMGHGTTMESEGVCKFCTHSTREGVCLWEGTCSPEYNNVVNYITLTPDYDNLYAQFAAEVPHFTKQVAKLPAAQLKDVSSLLHGLLMMALCVTSTEKLEDFREKFSEAHRVVYLAWENYDEERCACCGHVNADCSCQHLGAPNRKG
jgi:hypothetical protein